MSKQLVRIPLNPELDSVPNNNVSLALSADGKFLVVLNIAAAPRMWMANGTEYTEVTGLPFPGNLLAADFSSDGQYLITLSATAAQRFGLWSVNQTTGALTLIGYTTSTTIPAGSDGVLVNLSGDYFVCYQTAVAAGTVRIIKIDRTTSPFTLTVAASFEISTQNTSLYTPPAILPGKNAFIATKRRTDIYDVALFVFDPVGGTLSLRSSVDAGPGLGAPFFSPSVTQNGLHWHTTGNSQVGQARCGNIESDLSAITVTGYLGSPVAKLAHVAGFMFSDTVIFYGLRSGSAPFDQYAKVAPDFTITNNDGEVIAAESVPGLFATTGTRVNLASSKTATPRVHALRHQQTPVAVSPSISIYKEVIVGTPTDLIAEAPIGDAWNTAQQNVSSDLVATGPMGEAFTRLSMESVSLVAEAPMGDAFVSVLVDLSVSLVAEAPMGDAFAPVLVEDESTFYGTAPFADAWFVTSDQDIEAVALAPLGDAWVRFDNLVNSAFIAEAPMGEATATTTNAFFNLTAEAPMGDAGIAFSIIPGGCRRRSMVVV